MAITADEITARVPLDGDEYPYKHPADCPWPGNDALHRPWCRAIEGHKCESWGLHQHRPKVGMGGANPAAKVVAIICRNMSQAVDNHYAIDGGKKYQDSDGKDGHYRIYVLQGGKMRPVLDVRIPEGVNDALHNDGNVDTPQGREIVDGGLRPARREVHGENGSVVSVPGVLAGTIESAGDYEPSGGGDADVEGADAGGLGGLHGVGDSGSDWRGADGVRDPGADRVGRPSGTSEGNVGAELSVVPLGAGVVLGGPSPAALLAEDWSTKSLDELTSAFDTGSDQILVGLLKKGKAVLEYYRRAPDWKETAQHFHISKRTAEGLCGFYSAALGASGLTLENLAPIAESRSLVQSIGRRAQDDRSAALKAAVDYVATYGEAPTPAALHHALGVEAGTKKNVERYTVAQIAELFLEFPERNKYRNALGAGFSAFVAWLVKREQVAE